MPELQTTAWNWIYGFRAITHLCWLWLAVCLGACASVDPSQGYRQAAQQIGEATGESHVFQPGDEDTVQQRVADLLTGGLTLREATQIALINNRAVQASFFRIGVAEADFVQSGLFTNPSMSAALGVPSGGGLVLLEAGLTKSIVDLWQIPLRKRVADRERDRAILTVARLASDIVLDVKRAYFEVIRSERFIEISGDSLGIAQQLLELVVAQREAGVANDVDVNSARSEVLKKGAGLRLAKLRGYDAKAGILALLGLGVSIEEVDLVSPLPASMPAVSDDRLLDLALKHRLDLRAAHEAVEAARARINNQRRLFIRVVEPGVAFERESRKAGEDRELTVGPTLDIELPIFDQNQAQVAKAEYEYQEIRKRLQGLITTIKQNVDAAQRRSSALGDLTTFYRDELLPQEQAALDLARESYRAGATSFLSVLESQRRFLLSREDYLDTQHALANTLVDLEQAIGQPLDRIVLAPDGGE